MSTSSAQRMRPSEAFAPFIDDPLMFKPGTDYLYSSFGYILLSAVIESASKQSFADYMQQHIFTPAIANSITLDNPGKRSGRESMYFESGRAGKFEKSALVNNSGKFGAGGFNGNATDLAQVFSSLLEGKLGVSADYLRQTFPMVGEQTGKATRVSFGFFQMRAPKTNEIALFHNGSAIGGSASIALLPESGIVVVVLANIESTKLRSSAINIANIFAAP